MKLPNAERAVVDIEKLRDYCLSFEHPRGRHKARVFLSALGLTANHVNELYFALLDAAENEDAIVGERNTYGQRYVLDFVMSGPHGYSAECLDCSYRGEFSEAHKLLCTMRRY